MSMGQVRSCGSMPGGDSARIETNVLGCVFDTALCVPR
ncbi:hypothetical protein GLA29479_5155 [Lysobacter antibioticus]|nr:hypothetical protein GLA29479_5155 [Lysobacter antibioticus]